MSLATQVSTCAHPGCQCPVSTNAEYCSDYCKIAAQEEYCGCGHSTCNLQFAKRPAPEKVAS